MVLGFPVFLCCHYVLFILEVFHSPSSWLPVEAGQQLKGWHVSMDLGGALLLQAIPTQPSVKRFHMSFPYPLQHSGGKEGRTDEEETQKKTIQEYLTLSDCI